MTPDTTYRINPKLAWRDVDGRVAIVTPTTQELLILNPTGSLLWRFLSKETQSLASLAAILARQFDIKPRQAKRDAEVFLDALIQKGLIDAL